MTSSNDEFQDREWLLQKHVEEVLTRAHQILFSDDLTVAESKLGWLQVIEKMVQSASFDRQSEVIKERLRL
jgi:hypothetical protein